jgi:hypothetical protein
MPTHRSTAALESAILSLLAERAPGKTICPSEAARHIAPENWRPLMPAVRAAAVRLAEVGRIDITQHGRAVNPATAKGPLRLRLR